MTQQILRGANDAVTTDYQITGYVVDARGNLTRLISPDGSVVDMFCDNRDRLTQLTHQAGNRLVYTYDSTGNRQIEKAYLGASSITLTRSESFTVDLLDRLTQAQGSTVDQLTAIVYDATGRRTTITDPNNVQHMGSS